MPTDLFSVAEKRVVVTGGSRGVGFMLARAFLMAGARVLISARKAEALETAASELWDVGDCAAVAADLSTRDGAAELAAAVGDWSPRVDVLVNNAGAAWGAPLEDFPESGWDKVLDTNLKGVFYLTADLLPSLRAAAQPDDPARVVNVGSVEGIASPQADNYAYSASKAAVHMLTRHLAKRLASEHVTVNAIAPGPFESRMTAFALGDRDLRRRVERETPLGRIGQPDDIAGAAIYLTSRASSYVSGVVLPVDGGRTGAS